MTGPGEADRRALGLAVFHEVTAMLDRFGEVLS